VTRSLIICSIVDIATSIFLYTCLVVVHVFSDYYGYMDRGYGRGGMRGRGRGGRMMVTKCSCLTLLIVCHLTLQYNTALYTHIHCVHEKTVTHVYVPITLANNVGF